MDNFRRPKKPISSVDGFVGNRRSVSHGPPANKRLFANQPGARPPHPSQQPHAAPQPHLAQPPHYAQPQYPGQPQQLAQPQHLAQPLQQPYAQIPHPTMPHSSAPAVAAQPIESAEEPEPIVVEAPINDRRTPRSDSIRSIISTLVILISAPILAWCIVNYVFQSYEVEGPSMETTLHEHDRLIIWKLPHTISRITNKDYQPHRGDIIVFIKRGLFDFDANKEKQLVKRVIGLPGDRVTVKDGVLKIYNAEHPEGYEPDKTIKYDHVLPTTLGDVDVTVPAGEIFAAGDNRLNSLDSRYFGTVPDEDIVGKLVARILPVSKAQRF